MNQLEHLREMNTSRCNRWHPEGINSWSVMQWACATVGEAGEVCNKAKKIQRERDGLTGSRATIEDLGEEIADTIIYLDLLAASEGIDIYDAIKRKFNQVSEEQGFPERL